MTDQRRILAGMEEGERGETRWRDKSVVRGEASVISDLHEPYFSEVSYIE